MSGVHRRPTQKQRVLALLQSAGTRGVRTNEFLSERLPRFSARILELRNEGWLITSESDPQSANGAVYKMRGSQGPPEPKRQRQRRSSVEDRLLALAERFDVVTVSTRREPSAEVTKWTIQFGDPLQSHVAIGETLDKALVDAERRL